MVNEALRDELQSGVHALSILVSLVQLYWTNSNGPIPGPIGLLNHHCCHHEHVSEKGKKSSKLEKFTEFLFFPLLLTHRSLEPQLWPQKKNVSEKHKKSSEA